MQTRDGRPPDAGQIDRMQAALAHRGPDGAARLVRGDTALLHLRLAIVDLRTGDQPLFGPGGTALVANGEIYNDLILRQNIDWNWRSGSDCEPPVVLAARDGDGFAARLRGMYALAIHDSLTGRLTLSRDPFGIKPLYYAETADEFGFASEPQALLAAGFGRRAVDPGKRGELLQLKYTTGAKTIFPGILRVLPGETLTVQEGRIVASRALAALPAGPPEPIGRAAAQAKLGQVLLDSVAAHLRADVPYGLFLSGGIDSSVLLALMREAAPGRVQAITVGWEGAGVADESAEAERLARIAGADCERIVMTERDFWTLAPRIAASIDDPTADAAVLPSWLLGRAARRGGLKVALSGEGADELLGGYARYRKRRAPWRWLTRKPRAGGVFARDFSGWRDGIAAAERLVPSDRSPVQAAQEVDIAQWLPNDLLTKLDRTLMAHGVEGRTPFLDPVVAQLAFRLPDALKAGTRFGKVLLREWLAEAFPQAGAFARKKGFKPPVGAWMAGRADRLGRLVAAQPGIAEMMPAGAVQAAFASAATAPQPAYSLLFYALWHNHHILGRAADGSIDEVLG